MIPVIVNAPICLHNLCNIHGNKFDMEWVQEAKQTMQMENNHLLQQFQHKDMFHMAKQVIK